MLASRGSGDQARQLDFRLTLGALHRVIAGLALTRRRIGPDLKLQLPGPLAATTDVAPHEWVSSSLRTSGESVFLKASTTTRSMVSSSGVDLRQRPSRASASGSRKPERTIPSAAASIISMLTLTVL